MHNYTHGIAQTPVVAPASEKSAPSTAPPPPFPSLPWDPQEQSCFVDYGVRAASKSPRQWKNRAVAESSISLISKTYSRARLYRRHTTHCTLTELSPDRSEQPWKIPLFTSILPSNTHTHTHTCLSQSCHVSGSQHLSGQGPDIRVHGGLCSSLSAQLDRSVLIPALHDINWTFEPISHIIPALESNNRRKCRQGRQLQIECPLRLVWKCLGSFPYCCNTFLTFCFLQEKKQL